MSHGTTPAGPGGADAPGDAPRAVRVSTRLLASPRVLLVGLGAALLVSLPTLDFGFVADDFTHMAIIEGQPAEATPFDLFRFASGNPETLRPLLEQGPFPWWTLPELKLAFWRPLSSALHVLDHAVFGRWAPGHHLHSILWYLALVAAGGLLLRRALPGPVGGLALLAFAVDWTHAIPVGWIANRNALVALAPAVLGLVAHLRHREEGWRPGLPLSLAGYALGLLGGETAIGVFGLLGAYELFGREDRLVTRVRHLLPAGALAVCYLATYKAMGYGAFGSGLYVDALAEPWDFLRVLPDRMFALVGGQLSLVPAEASTFGRGAQLVQRAAGGAALVGFAWLLRRAWPGMTPAERRGARWLFGGSLLALLPVISTFAHNRLLLLASLGGCVAVALVVRDAWRRRRGTAPERGVALAVAALVAVPHLVISPMLMPASGLLLRALTRGLQSAIHVLTSIEGCCTERNLVVLTDADFLSALFTPLVQRADRGELPRSWHVLSMAPCNHRVERTGPATLELRCEDGRMLQAEFERLFRGAAHPLRAGDRVALALMTVTVLEVAPEGGPTRLEFRFSRPLEDPAWLFLAWRDGRFHPVTLPPVGGNLSLPLDRSVPR